jgi:hypothetical protein
MKNKTHQVFLNSIIPAAMLLALGIPATAQTKKPNVIYILADDLGIGDLSCYGQ